NPGTVTEIGSSVRISQALLDEAGRRALAHTEQCKGSGACDWPSSVTIATEGQPYSRSEGVANAVTVQVMLVAASGEFNAHVGVQVLLIIDDDGSVLEASCSGLPGFSEQPMPCEV
ncbi:MAG TPA: hypothetical protein VFM87_06350, partial [Agrococcus sp.]|nr:hypothetical protein [Agrococcus sp.]